MLRLILAIALATAAFAAEFTGEVIKVLDGDTLDVMDGDYKVRVRLYGVDTPEKKAAYGREATEFTYRLAMYQRVTVVDHGTDRYGRAIGTVILPGDRSLNQEIVRAGCGWWYEKYAPLSTDLRDLQAQAQREHRGLWSSYNPEPPWQWRKEQREAPHWGTGRSEPRSESRSRGRSQRRSQRRSLR